MQTLSELRKGIYENPDLPMCSSLPLYVIVESNPRPENPNAARFGHLESNGTEGIMLFVSPLDAVIKCREFNKEGGHFGVSPFESYDPRRTIRSQNGWLSMYIFYGFAAHGNKLILNEDGYLSGLSYPLHHQFKVEDVEEHIHLEFHQHISDWLDRVHRAVGLPDYPSLVYEQAKSSMAELEMIASTALQIAEYTEPDERKPVQCAIYDPVESQWCFADYDTI